MANPNIDLLGAVYPAVSGIELPKQGGGSATFPWVEGSQNITQNGTFDVSSLAEVNVNVSGGGASNFVTGTFTTPTTAQANTITVPYSGNGFPIAAIIFVDAGMYNSAGDPDWYNLVMRYNIGMWAMSKGAVDLAPDYYASTTQNNGIVTYGYKGSTTTATSYSFSGSRSVQVFNTANATAGNTTCVRFQSKTALSYYTVTNASYGFASGIKYRYIVVYSA